jgi:anti-sigma28 factor (negative regulator of flagellin synthesis)
MNAYAIASSTTTATARPRQATCENKRVIGPLATLRIITSEVDETREARLARLRAEVRAGTYVADLDAIAERLLAGGLI